MGTGTQSPLERLGWAGVAPGERGGAAVGLLIAPQLCASELESIPVDEGVDFCALGLGK